MPVRDKGQEIFCRTLDAPFVGSFKARLGFFLGGYAFVFVGHGASLMVMTKIQTPQQVQAILAEVRSQTDRGAAIVAAAVLDDILRTLILARFVELSAARRDALFEGINAPLSSFSARIEVAFAAGIFSNEARVALHFVRKIRNAFAHRIEQITFDHPEIKNLTDGMPQSVKGDSYRDEFIKLFHQLAAFLYGALAADSADFHPTRAH
jgi:heme exporter protein D